MRIVQALDAEAQLPGLFDDVERGETVLVIRDGKAIARIVPEVARRQDEVERGIEMIKSVRQHTARTTVDEILSARDEGRRF